METRTFAFDALTHQSEEHGATVVAKVRRFVRVHIQHMRPASLELFDHAERCKVKTWA